jgi:hypothetical protein
MKKLIISILLPWVIITNTRSQDLLGFENTFGIERMDYKKAENKALEASAFLLSTAIDSEKSERDKALTYMLMWMEGTPDYTFYIDANIGFFTRSNNKLLAIYMAGLTKLSIENPVLAKNRDDLKYQCIELYIDYCINPSNHVKSYRELDRLIKAREKGRLKNFIRD